MMFKMRLLMILSVSVAVPLNFKGDKEGAEEYLVIDDIVNGDDMDADGLHSYTSQNTGRDKRLVINAEEISFSHIGTVIFGNGDSQTTPDQTTPDQTTPDHMPPKYQESAPDNVCTTGENSFSCFCKSDATQKGEMCLAEQNCNEDGTCIDVCEPKARNKESCICKSVNSNEGKICTALQGCTQNGNYIDDCWRSTAKEPSDCMCKSPFGEIAVCTAGQVCQYGACIKDPEACKGVKNCYDERTKGLCPITCDQVQPDFCEIMKIEGCNSEFAKEYCEDCIEDCDKEDAYRNQEDPLVADCMCSKRSVKKACRKGNHCMDDQGCTCQDKKRCPDQFPLFILFG